MTVNEAISEFDKVYADISAALPAPLGVEREVVWFDKDFNEVMEGGSAVSVSLDVLVSTPELSSARDRLAAVSLLFDFRNGVILDQDAEEQISAMREDARLFIDEILAQDSPEDFIKEAILAANDELSRFEEDINKTVKRTNIFSLVAILAVAAAVITTAIVLLVN